MFSINKSQYWDGRILNWEYRNYFQKRPFSFSLRSRRALFLQLMKNHLAGKRIVELGCGSGLLIEDLFRAGISRYTGYDFSQIAISNAAARASQLGLTGQTQFVCRNVTEEITEISTSDFCFSLGLMDWLEDHEIVTALTQHPAIAQIHSFSENRMLIARLLHSSYVGVTYGRNSGGYLPRYRSRSEVDRHFANSGLSIPIYFTNIRMTFSTFAHNLPDEIQK